jgi:putative flippase GtrA
VSTLQRSRPRPLALGGPAAARPARQVWREMLGFPLVGTVGTIITIGGANLLRGWLGGGPMTTTVLPTMIATQVSYLAHRHWTFRHRDSDGSGREVIVFFGLNAVGMLIQMLCSGFTYYTLGLRGTLAYNLALLAGLGAASVFRYWSYKKWVFTLAVR